MSSFKKLFVLIGCIYVGLWSVVIILFIINEWSLRLLLLNVILYGIHLLFIALILIWKLHSTLRSAFRKGGFPLLLKRFGTIIILPALALYVLGISIYLYNTLEAFEYTWNYSVENQTGRSKDYFAGDGKILGMSYYEMGRGKQVK